MTTTELVRSHTPELLPPQLVEQPGSVVKRFDARAAHVQTTADGYVAQMKSHLGLGNLDVVIRPELEAAEPILAELKTLHNETRADLKETLRLSQSSKYEQAAGVVEVSPYREQLAKDYKNWISSLPGGKPELPNGMPMAYVPQGFDGDWNKFGPREYELHKLSIVGLRNGIPGEVTGADVVRALKEKKQVMEENKRQTEIVKDAYRAFNEHNGNYGLAVGSYDPNRVYFLNQRRFDAWDLHRGSAAIALVAGYPTGDVLVNRDGPYFKKEDMFFSTMVHELGHQSRNNGMYLAGRDYSDLEEGIIQSNAIEVSKAENKYNPDQELIYKWQQTLAKSLAEQLGVQSFMNHGHDEIRQMMVGKYGMVNGEHPYDALRKEIESAQYFKRDATLEVFEEPREATPEDLLRVETIVQSKVQAFKNRWGFDIPNRVNTGTKEEKEDHSDVVEIKEA